MGLTVLSVAYPFAPVGPDAVGGSEQILNDLDRKLVSAGHVSLVVACEGSRPFGQLFPAPLPQSELRDEASREWYRKKVQAAIDRALSSRPVDLIHMHGLNFHEYSLPPRIPTLVTLHLPIAWYPQDVWKRYDGRVVFQCVSESQRRSCPPELRGSPVVTNGVALPPTSKVAKSNVALGMGRICPEKNLHEALEAGTLAGIRVLLGGRVFPYPEHRRYFRDKIQPLLRRHTQHRFLGPLSPGRRTALLKRAKCLLHPTLAPETSSLVAMEAMAAGTPVIAYRSGALPDIVEDGVTGFLVDSAKEMAEAIREIHKIRPEACREAAERRFSGERMLQQYFELYGLLVASGAERLHA